MRVTDNTRTMMMERANARLSSRMVDAARAASAGQRVTKPSDDPVAYAAGIREAAHAATLSARSRTARGAADDLSLAESALDAAGEVFTRAQEIANQGANEALGATERASLAREATSLKESLLQIANTKGASGYLFGGTKTDQAPFDVTGKFGGNDGVVRAPITDAVDPPANASGARAFTAAGGTDAFAALDGLIAALGSNDPAATRASLTGLEGARAQVTQVQVDTGLSMERLHTAADVIDNSLALVSDRASRELGADDQAGLYTELEATKSAYERSLAVTRELLSVGST